MSLQRLRAHIDGFNLYFGLDEAGLRGALWLDLVDLVERLLPADHYLESVRYYTARVKRPADSRERQSLYLDALRAHRPPPQLEIIEGFVRYEPWDCKHCDRTTDRRVEKRTDVNLAVDMVTGAHADAYDTVMLISGDADQVAAVEAVRAAGKRVIVAFPPERPSQHLRTVDPEAFTISRSKIRKSLLPDTVMTATGYRLERPAVWRWGADRPDDDG